MNIVQHSKGKNSPFYINRVGEVHINKQGCSFEVIECRGSMDCDVCIDGGLILYNVQYGHIKRGTVENPFHPTVHSKGFVGIGRHLKSINSRQTTMYKKWVSILERSYCPKWHVKYPTYKTCEVVEEWLNFQIFGDWFEEHYKEGYQLDKDLLSKGNKIYSPETCCFVPQEVNLILIKCDKVRGELPIGVSKYENRFRATISRNGKPSHIALFDTIEESFQAYKFEKEKQIKEVANRCKPYMVYQAYEALINYQVEITD